MDKPNLDLMRAIAISLVVVDHTLLSLGINNVGRLYIGDMGLFGVYVFFVHTSLVLMWSLERKPHILNFYLRRIFRIYPLALVTITAAYLFHSPVAGVRAKFFTASIGGLRNLFANLSLLQDFRHDPHIIHGVTWSLPPEIYMYVLLPMFFVFAVRETRVWPLLVVWFLCAAHIYRDFGQQIGNSFPILIPDFIPGVMAYICFRVRRPVLPWWLLPILLAVLCVFVMALPRVRADWLACLILGLSLASFRQVTNSPIKRISHIIAKYSYGLYLTHPFGIVLGMYLMHASPVWLQLAVAATSTAILSYLGYRFIEEPCIRLGVRLAARTYQNGGDPSILKASLM